MYDAVFSDLRGLAAQLDNLPAPDEAARAAAAERNADLTKPPGALGRLEEIAIWFAGWRAAPRPFTAKAHVLIFAGSHGVTAQGVSPFPAEVTGQMVANFEAGGAAINQLADHSGAGLTVTPLDVETPTQDISAGAAMDEAAFCEAVKVGWNAVPDDVDWLILGEMGIGNTTVAAALAAHLFSAATAEPAELAALWVGPGTGAAGPVLERKRKAVRDALALHRPALMEAQKADAAAPGSPPTAALEAARRLGGRELAAMLGAAIRARRARMPVVLDGFVATAALAPLHFMQPGALDAVIAGHRSAEPAHDRMLTALGMKPILDLGMRLGEGSGAALALAVLNGALACHSGMARFSDAGVARES